MRRRTAITTLVLCLTLAAPAVAGLGPLDGQVNNDPSGTGGIDPTMDAGASDVVGGALTAGALEIPWATFEQQTASEQNIFVRAFKGGQWVTEGFPASLNISANQEAEEPAIDFAGADRTVPWVSWYEPNPLLAGGTPTQIFASRFAANAAAAGGGAWVPEGQDRTAGSQIPSLNIHTIHTAESPAVAGGATTAGNPPVPWVAWREEDGNALDADSTFQIFVVKGIKLPAGDNACPVGTRPTPGSTSVSSFCWQQVGLGRLNANTAAPSSSGDPTLNIDPTRNAVEPDFAFTGPNDTVGWVVWYEEDASTLTGLSDTNEQVFAAKLVPDATTDAGGFHWQAVGHGTGATAQILDTSGANGFGACTVSKAAEEACTLNKVATNGAENPRVATGSLAPGGNTVPWVVWQEHIGSPDGTTGIFVSRLVGDHFELFNGGNPISNSLHESTDPDIAFSGHIPYVTWHETIGGQDRLFAAHFEGGAATPTLKIDTPDGITASTFGLTPGKLAPISSTCTATPFSADGTTCRGGALGTPFTLFTDGGPSGGKLFADGYEPSTVTTGDATAITSSGATLAGSANPGGAAAATGFDAGPSTAYGTTVASSPFAAGTAVLPFTAALTGQPAASVVHYRAFASSDFTKVTGADRTFTTAAATPTATPTVTPTPTPKPTPAADKRPTSRITGLKSKQKARALKKFKGAASDPDDGVARVDIAVTRLSGGAKAAAARKRCQVLTSSGRLRTGKTKSGRCVPAFLKAKGTKAWTFTLKKRLPAGSYEVYSRATDKAGKRQAGFNSGNRKAFKLR